jgi:hypothetical protein
VSYIAYKHHPIQKSIAELLEIQTAPALADPDIADDAELAFARDKIFAISNTIQTLLRSTPATLASMPALTLIHQALQDPINDLRTYISQKNPVYISQAASRMEQIIPLLHSFSPQVQLSNVNLVEILERQDEVAANAFKRLTEQRDSLAAKLESMVEAAGRERAEATTAVAKLEIAFATTESERAIAFKNLLTHV